MKKTEITSLLFCTFLKKLKTFKKVLTYVLKSSTIQNVTRQIVSNMNWKKKRVMQEKRRKIFKTIRLYVEKFLLKFDEAERSLLFQLEVHWKVNNKQTFEETKR